METYLNIEVLLLEIFKASYSSHALCKHSLTYSLPEVIYGPHLKSICQVIVWEVESVKCSLKLSDNTLSPPFQTYMFNMLCDVKK